MSEFLIVNDEKLNRKNVHLGIKSFEKIGIKSSDIKVVKVQGYTCFLDTRVIDFYQEDVNSITILIGVCIFKEEYLKACNFSIEDTRNNFDKLSGRFQIIHIKGGIINIINSLFGSLPCFIYSEGLINSYSSSLSLFKHYFKLNLDTHALKQKILFFCNYNCTILEGVQRLKPASFFTYNSQGKVEYCYLREAIVTSTESIDIELVVKNISERLDYLLSRHIQNFKDLYLSFSGGRDSRFLACKLLQFVSKDRLSLFTVGCESDVEYRIARKYSKSNNIIHHLFKPVALDRKQIENYSSIYSTVNFPVQYQIQFEKYLKDYKGTFVNTIIPENILSHMKYFMGNEHPAINFIKNRRTVTNENDVVNGAGVFLNTTSEVIKIWDFLRLNLPNEIITNIFFENSTYQADWVYSILRPFDRTNKVICLFEDPVILSLLSQVPKEYLEDDKFYNMLVSSSCPEIYTQLTTRQISKEGLKSLSLLQIIRNYKEISRSILYSLSLGYLTDSNKFFLKNYILDNCHLLDGFFESQYIYSLERKLSSNKFSTNRLKNFLNRKLLCRYLDEYELIIPVCTIGLIKIFNKKDK